MARQRDYRAEHARRNERAQARGFKNYSEERKYRRELKKYAPDVVRFNRLDSTNPKFNLTKDIADRILHQNVQKGEGPTSDLANDILDNLNLDPRSRDAEDVIRSVFDWVYYSQVTF